MSSAVDFATVPRSEVDELFGPKADSKKATETLKYRPDFYHAAKQAGVYVFGTISESMLPVKYRISKQNLETKRRADLAAQQNDLIEVPMQVCDRVGLPYGTKLSYENFTKAVMGRQTV